ncbi:MAG: ferredoxin [Acidimicrobiales bacterium]
MNQPTSETDATVAVAVDSDVCIGAGQCEMMEEETFLLDDVTSISAVIGTGRLPPDRAEAIVNTCPSGAISIVTEEESP